MVTDQQHGSHPGPTVVAVAVVEDGGCVLVGKRSAEDPLAGLWEFPGGKVLTSETPARAAVRECLEETGLETRIVASYGVVEHPYPHGLIRIHFFSCRVTDRSCAPRPPFRWVPVRRLEHYAFPAANTSVIRQLAKSV